MTPNLSTAKHLVLNESLYTKLDKLITDYGVCEPLSNELFEARRVLISFIHSQLMLAYKLGVQSNDT